MICLRRPPAPSGRPSCGFSKAEEEGDQRNQEEEEEEEERTEGRVTAALLTRAVMG